jgi:1,4-alpha-glucan branching enzyme
LKFIYDTGIRRRLFRNVRVRGSWDDKGKHSDSWSEHLTREVRGADGALTYEVEVALDPSQKGETFHWSVLVDSNLGRDRGGITTEQLDGDHEARYRTFQLGDDANAEQRYYLTHVRRLGARKVRLNGQQGYGLRFSVWHPTHRAWRWCSEIRPAATSRTTAPGSIQSAR